MTSGLAIYDTMQYVLTPVCTWCVGQAASMGSLLLAAGAPGMRHALPNARIMVHQPSGGARVRPPCPTRAGGGLGRGLGGLGGGAGSWKSVLGRGEKGLGRPRSVGSTEMGRSVFPMLCVCGEGARKERGQCLEGRKGITWMGGDVLGPPRGCGWAWDSPRGCGQGWRWPQTPPQTLLSPP